MESEALFRAGLDANPGDHSLRLVYADWLEDRGDWRAAGYSWMGRHKKSPRRTNVRPPLSSNRFLWTTPSSDGDWSLHDHLPEWLCLKLRGISPYSWFTHHTLLEAEIIICKAFTQLVFNPIMVSSYRYKWAAVANSYLSQPVYARPEDF